jgi:hypothetical protein
VTKTAVLVTDRQLLPARRGNVIRIVGMLRSLRALGWRVVLICLSSAGSDDALREEADEIFRVRARAFDGGEVAAFDSRPFQSAVEWVVAARRPQLVITEYAWLAPALTRLRTVKRVVDCHDVLHQRTSRFDAAGLDPWVRCTPGQERALLRHADLLLTGQNDDRDILRALLPSTPVTCVFPRIDAVMGPSAPRTNTRVLAVGAFHAGNDGIPRFAAHAWPAVIGAVPGARLDVVGSVRAGAPGPGVAFVGEVDDLSDWYRSAAVVVCPVEVGSGVKIKMIEALRYGKAVVATSAAVEGLPPANEPAWVEARTIDECAEATASLLSRPDDRVALELRAQAYAARHFSPESIGRDLDAALASSRRAHWLLTRAATAMR